MVVDLGVVPELRVQPPGVVTVLQLVVMDVMAGIQLNALLRH